MSEASETPLGETFAVALGEKDFEGLLGVLDPEVDFRGLTPRRSWEANRARAVVDDVFRRWFEPSDEIDEIISVETDQFADCRRVAYRFRGRSDGSPFVVEQQAYYREREGTIVWLRILCSGFRPA